MNVRVDAAGSQDQAFAGDDLGGCTDRDRDAGLDVGVAGFADRSDHAVLQTNIGLDDAGHRIEDECIGDHGVDHVGRHPLALAHAVSDHLAAAELDLFAIDGVIGLDLDDQIGIGQPQSITDGGAVHFRIRAARESGHGQTFFFLAARSLAGGAASSGPITIWRNP